MMEKKQYSKPSLKVIKLSKPSSILCGSPGGGMTYIPGQPGDGHLA